MHHGWARILFLFLLCAGSTRAQSPPVIDPLVKPPESAAPVPKDDDQSEASRVARAQRALEENTARLSTLKASVADPMGEYAQAEAAFQALDADREKARQALVVAKNAGETARAEELNRELEALEPTWKLARDRFDLAIQERKTLKEQIAALEEKVKQDRETLDKLLGAGATSQPALTVVPTTAPAVVTEPAPAVPAGPQAAPPEEKPQTTPMLLTPRAPSKELIEAREQAQVKEQEAQEAEQEVRSVVSRVDVIHKSIELERKMLDTVRKKLDNAAQTEQALDKQLETRTEEGAPQEALRDIWRQILETRRRQGEAQIEYQERINSLDRLQDELASLQGDQISALQQAESKRQEAEEARKTVEKLQNPLSPFNILRWLVQRGPKLFAILAAVILMLWFKRRLSPYITRFMTQAPGRGTTEEIENRSRTLVGVGQNAATIIIVTGGLLMFLDTAGVNIVPLMGGAAVLGLAVAFGAQNLIKDYFSGFMILLENQYGVNDVVKIGQIEGQVEDVTLRITVLRDQEGTVHFIPNGQIVSVSNYTHGWSRAVFAIAVSYEEDVDRIMVVLTNLAKSMRQEPAYAGMILDDPDMLGVDSLGESSVVIKFLLKTRPTKQWTVKRELLRRIKKKFDELKIDVPYPQRTIFHRYEQGEVPPDSASAAKAAD